VIHQLAAPTRILVVANETLESELVHDLLRTRAAGGRRAQVLVVAPALNGRLRHWLSDTDAADAQARTRLRRCLHRLAEAGVDANGMVGDADPLQATADALRLFPADEIVLATGPVQTSWLERRLAERIRARFALPLRHVVVGGPPRLAAA
jgi:hypothetical protein